MGRLEELEKSIDEVKSGLRYLEREVVQQLLPAGRGADAAKRHAASAKSLAFAACVLSVAAAVLIFIVLVKVW